MTSLKTLQATKLTPNQYAPDHEGNNKQEYQNIDNRKKRKKAKATNNQQPNHSYPKTPHKLL